MLMYVHIFLMVIQIFTEKFFSPFFKKADPLNMVDPSFFSFLRDLHTDNPFKSVKLGDEKADVREKFQSYPTLTSRHRNVAKLLGNVENLNFRK